MNGIVKGFIKKIMYTISSNLISFLISTLVIIVLPKYIGVEQYGYFQLYSFYSSYIIFLHLGWTDGIYLKIGGEDYDDLNKPVLFSQFYMLLFFQIFVGVLIYFIGRNYIFDNNRLFILKMISICLVVTNVLSLPKFILQATSRIREYSKIIVYDRVIYFSCIILILLFGFRDYKFLIFADVIGRLAALVLGILSCKDIFIRKAKEFSFSISETYENINIGIKLMLAYIASMLIIGTIRFGIERTWNIETFAKVSLTLSASNLMMLFINAIGIIIFPMLRKTDTKKLPMIYTNIRDMLMPVLLGLLSLYYPIKVLMEMWLPQYTDSLLYMALVFPMFIYEGKMSLLINTYYKTLREEKLILKINIISFILSVLLTIITTQIFTNLNLAIISIVIVLSFRSVLAEVNLSRILNIPIYKDIFMESLCIVVFIISFWFVDSYYSLILYMLFYTIYMIVKKNDISNTISNMKNIIKK